LLKSAVPRLPVETQLPNAATAFAGDMRGKKTGAKDFFAGRVVICRFICTFAGYV